MGSVLERLQSTFHRHARVGIERTYIYRLRSDDPRPPVFHARGDTTTIDVVPRSSLHLLASVGYADPSECAARITRGDRCYGVWIDDSLVHYSWAQHRGAHSIDAAGLTMVIPAGEVWIYNCRTAESHRGRGLYPQTLHRIVDDYFAAGARAAWIYTTEDNEASQHGIRKLGFTQTATLRALRVGGYYRALNDNVDPAM